jgi:hypothetical protein
MSEREFFYGDMRWLFDTTDCFKRFKFLKRDNGELSFKWQHARRYVLRNNRPTFLDFGPEHGIFELTSADAKRSTGRGKFISKQEFIERYVCAI